MMVAFACGLKLDTLVEKWSAIKHDRFLLWALLNPLDPWKNSIFRTAMFHQLGTF